MSSPRPTPTPNHIPSSPNEVKVTLTDYDFYANRCRDKVMWLVKVGEWSGRGDRTMSFTPGSSPWVLYWTGSVTSQLAHRFDVGIALADAWTSAIPWGGEATTPYSQCNNHSIRHEQGKVTVYVRASGVEWTVRAYIEP